MTHGKSALIGLLTLATPLAPAFGESLNAAQQEAVLTALEDEYHAFAFYEAVIEKFGPVAPFENIQNAEASHILALTSYLTENGVAYPDNPYLNGEKPRLEAPATIAEACAIGVDAEIANIDLYRDNLMPAIAGKGELTAIFVALSQASEDKHLPAFTACAS
ncbi:MAG TPA: hypothetical protein ENK28_07000 [Aliiroseovarius sp.]|nr:hypothetical protein [Aliiroseovarius sp.]